MFARFDKNPAITLQNIEGTKRYGPTYARTDNLKTVYPPQTKFEGGIISDLIGFVYDLSDTQDGLKCLRMVFIICGKHLLLMTRIHVFFTRTMIQLANTVNPLYNDTVCFKLSLTLK